MDILWWIFGGIAGVGFIGYVINGSSSAVDDDVQWEDDDDVYTSSISDDLSNDSDLDLATGSSLLDDEYGVPGDSSFLDSDHAAGIEINPASGLPMIDDIGGVDVGGNPYGTDLSDDYSDMSSGFDSGFDDSFSSIDDSFSSMDDSFSSFDDY